MTEKELYKILKYKYEEDVNSKLLLLSEVAEILASVHKHYHLMTNIGNLNGETWHPIPLHKKYMISNFTRVKSFMYKKPKILKPSINKSGYANLRLYDDDKQSQYWLVHKLVGLVFLNIPKTEEINHISGIKLQNIPINLEIGSDKFNVQHAIALGLRRSKGQENPNASLTNDKVLEIFQSTLKVEELAIKYGVSISVISSIRTGRSWGGLTGKRLTTKYGLSKETVLAILNEEGSHKGIGEKFKVSKTTVQYIKNGNRYSEITGKKFKRTRPYYRLSENKKTA